MEATITNPDREYFSTSDALDLHFAVIESVRCFLEEYEGRDARALTNALFYSFQILRETFAFGYKDNGGQL
jgi:hypothetical protein